MDSGKLKMIDYAVFPGVNPESPLFVLNCFGNEGSDLVESVKSKTAADFTLVTINVPEWNRYMTPWPAAAPFGNEEPYEGLADDFLKRIVSGIIPEIIEKYHLEPKSRIIAGYSLAGLFSIYSLYRTDFFDYAISCSGSFWYPDFLDFVKKNEILRKPSKIYLSLGNQESRTKNRIMRTVEDNTRYIQQIFLENGVKTVFELNPGGHFTDSNERLAKAITWILSE